MIWDNSLVDEFANHWTIDVLKFKLYPEKCRVSMDWRVNNRAIPQKIKGWKMTQFPVNSNIATTGHKLQGQTKNIWLLLHGILDVRIGSMSFYQG